MSESVEKTMEEIVRAISEDQVQQPHMAREDVIGEAREFSIVIKRDSADLVKKGHVAEMIASYDARIELYDGAASTFATSLFDKTSHHNNWDFVEKGAYEFKWFLLEELDFCFENYPEGKKYVKEIRKGRGRRDLVCDYSDTAALIEKERARLTESFFDFSLEEKCKTDGRVLAELLSNMMMSPELVEEHKIFSYQAFTYLNEATQELRRIGQHIFRRDADKLAEYKSDHYQNLHATALKNKAAAEADAAVNAE